MRKKFGMVWRMLGPFLGLIFTYLIFFLVAPDTFHSLYNTKTILTQTVIIGIAAMGMTLVIVSAGIDLSAGSMIALATVVTALILRGWGDVESSFMLPLAAALAGILVCAFCGLLNGLMISYLRVVPFIVTLGMMQIIRGMAKGISQQTTINTSPNWLSSMMTVELRIDVWHSVAPGVWLMLAILGIMYVVLRYTVFGRHVYAVGSSESTARLCGIRVKSHRVWVYGISGLLTGISGVMSFSALNLGDPTGAVGMELDIIAAVVIGGGSFNGGEGSVVGSVVGALVISVLRSGCQAVGVENYVQNIVIGAIIIMAVGIDQLKRKQGREA